MWWRRDDIYIYIYIYVWRSEMRRSADMKMFDTKTWRRWDDRKWRSAIRRSADRRRCKIWKSEMRGSEMWRCTDATPMRRSKMRRSETQDVASPVFYFYTQTILRTKTFTYKRFYTHAHIPATFHIKICFFFLQLPVGQGDLLHDSHLIFL